MSRTDMNGATQLVSSGLPVGTPEQAAGELVQAQRRARAFLDDLTAAAVDEEARAQLRRLDDVIFDLEAAYQRATAARLMAALVAVTEGDYTIFIAPSGGAS